jgi:hypothetical protein
VPAPKTYGLIGILDKLPCRRELAATDQTRMREDEVEPWRVGSFIRYFLTMDGLAEAITLSGISKSRTSASPTQSQLRRRSRKAAAGQVQELADRRRTCARRSPAISRQGSACGRRRLRQSWNGTDCQTLHDAVCRRRRGTVRAHERHEHGRASSTCSRPGNHGQSKPRLAPTRSGVAADKGRCGLHERRAWRLLHLRCRPHGRLLGHRHRPFVCGAAKRAAVQPRPRRRSRDNVDAARQPGDLRAKQLVNWGYAICDCSLRAHYSGPVKAAGPDPIWPYREAAVGLRSSSSSPVSRRWRVRPG